MREIIMFFRNINRIWLMMLFAVLLGLASMLLFKNYLAAKEQAAVADAVARSAGGVTVDVIAASKDIPKGAVLGLENLSKRSILKDLVNEEMLPVSDFGRIEGLKSTRLIKSGLPLRNADVLEKPKGFSEMLEPGLRAITIEVDDNNSIAQMVKPGNMMDLLVIVPDVNDAAGGSRVVLVLQKVKVLATGQKVNASQSGANTESSLAANFGVGQAKEFRYSTFTFEVTPQDAGRIALAQQMGKIRAILRGTDDVTKITMANVNTKGILDVTTDKSGKSLPPPVQPDVVQFIIGGRGPGNAPVNVTSSGLPKDPRDLSNAELASMGMPADVIEKVRQQPRRNQGGMDSQQQGLQK